MTGKLSSSNSPSWPAPLSDVAMEILDPVLRKRAGISMELVQSWPEIVGDGIADLTRPEKIAWPRRQSEDDPFEPATLIIACEGRAALKLQHETSEVIARVNSFLGFIAIGRIKIIQKTVQTERTNKPLKPRPLSPLQRMKLDQVVASVEDEGLRKSLEKLGASIYGSKNKKSVTKS